MMAAHLIKLPLLRQDTVVHFQYQVLARVVLQILQMGKCGGSTVVPGLIKMRSRLGTQFMAFFPAHSAYFNVSRQKVPYVNVSRQKVPYFNVSRQNRVIWLSLALSGALWLTLALSGSL